MKIELVPIGKVKPNPNNPRHITDLAFQQLVKSIQDFPEMLDIRPIVVDKDFMVLGGNQRLKACKAAGLKKVPIIQADSLTPEQQREFQIRDNISQGDWDWTKLHEDWDSEELSSWGLEDEEEGKGGGKNIEGKDDDYQEPDNLQVDVVLGDLIEIGQHRLLCGDSTDSDAVDKVMGNEKIDLVFTDPPYGISIVGGGKAFGSVGGGKIVNAKTYSEVIGDDSTDTARDFYNTCVSLGMENFIIWGGNYFTDFLPPSMCWLVWDKENTGNFADVELAWTSFNKAAKLYKWLWNGMSRKGERSIEGKTRVHPTQKPVGLFCEIFKDFEFVICFDGFLGSGSTMVAAHQLNRKCYGLELSPRYCQVIINRMLKLDPSLKVKLNGKDYLPKVPF